MSKAANYGLIILPISRPIWKKQFQFHGILAWTIHDAPRLTHFCGPVCGPRIKSCHSRSLRKEVFDEYKHFLPKNHRYQTTEKTKFNGKEENGKKPRRKAPHLWKLENNRNR